MARTAERRAHLIETAETEDDNKSAHESETEGEKNVSLHVKMASTGDSSNARDVSLLLKGAWISHFLLSTRFGARRLLLENKSSTWSTFFSNPITISSPNDIYTAITESDGRKLAREVVEKLRACSDLSLCFYDSGTPQPITYPERVPYLSSAPSLQPARKRKLEERKQYAIGVKRDELNNPHTLYLDSLYERIEETKNRFNSLREIIWSQMSQHDSASQELILDAQLKAHQDKVDDITASLIDFVEQTFFILMGMVEVVDYSNLEVCQSFAKKYKGDRNKYTKTMDEHSKICRRLFSLIKRFNRPSEVSDYARDFAFLSVLFPYELPHLLDEQQNLVTDKEDVKRYGVSPLAVPFQAIQFAKLHRGGLFVFCFGSDEVKHILPATSFYNRQGSESSDVAKALDGQIEEAMEKAVKVAEGGSERRDSVVEILQSRRTAQCQTVRAAALKRLNANDNERARQLYTEVGLDPSSDCPKDECVSARIRTALDSRNGDLGAELAQAVLSYNEEFGGCDVNDEISQKLCKARVARASMSPSFEAADAMNNGDVEKFADTICDPHQQFYAEFAKQPPNINDAGRSDAEKLNSMTARYLKENQMNCLPALQSCTRSDLATCLIAALARNSPKRFETQWTACKAVREDIDKHRPNREELSKESPCMALASLTANPGPNLNQNVLSVLEHVYREACGDAPGIVVSQAGTASDESFDAFLVACAQKLYTVFDRPDTILKEKAFTYLQNHGNLERGTVFPPRYAATMNDVMRALQVVQAKQALRIDSYFKFSLPFDTLDLSALDMFFCASAPFDRSGVQDGVWVGRPLAWALTGHGTTLPTVFESPQKLLESTNINGDSLPNDALGAMYVFLLFACINNLLKSSPQMKSHEVAQRMLALCSSLYDKSIDSLQKVSEFRSYEDPVHTLSGKVELRAYRIDKHNVRRFRRITGSEPARDYARKLAYESVGHMLTNLKSSRIPPVDMWTNHFRMLLSVAPYLSNTALVEGNETQNVGTLDRGHLNELIETLEETVPEETPESQPETNQSGGIWRKPMFVVEGARVQKQIMESLGVKRGWKSIFPSNNDIHVRLQDAQLIPLAGGDFVKHIFEIIPEGRNRSFWEVWTIALMGVYFPKMFENVPTKFEKNQFDLSSAHLLYRVLKIGGHHLAMGDDLGIECFRFMQEETKEDRNAVGLALQKVLWCGAFIGNGTTTGKTNEYSPSVVDIGQIPKGIEDIEGTGVFGCIADQERWNKWVNFKTVPSPLQYSNSSDLRWTELFVRTNDDTDSIPTGKVPNVLPLCTTPPNKIIDFVQKARSTNENPNSMVSYLVLLSVAGIKWWTAAASLAQTTNAKNNLYKLPFYLTLAGGALGGIYIAAGGIAAGGIAAGVGVSSVLKMGLNRLKNLWENKDPNTESRPPFTILAENYHNDYINLAQLERQHMLSVNHKVQTRATDFKNPTIPTQTFFELFVMVCYLYEGTKKNLTTVEIPDIAEMLREKTEDNSVSDQWYYRLFGGDTRNVAPSFPVTDALRNNYLVHWNLLSPVNFFMSLLQERIMKYKEEEFKSFLTMLAVYSRIVTIVGVVYAQCGTFGEDMSGEQRLKAAIIISQIKNIDAAKLNDVRVDESERFKALVCHELFDPQRVMFRDPDIIPYSLISNLNGQQDTEPRQQLQKFVLPILSALYSAKSPS